MKSFGGRDLGSQRAGGGLAPPQRLSQFGTGGLQGAVGASCWCWSGVSLPGALSPGCACAIPQGHPGTKPQPGNVPGERGMLGVGAEDPRGGSSGSSGRERRMLGVGAEDAAVGVEDVWGHHGGCSGGSQGCSGCSWRTLGERGVLEVSVEDVGVSVEGARGERGGCLEGEQRMLVVIMEDARAAQRGMLRLTGAQGKTCRLSNSVQ